MQTAAPIGLYDSGLGGLSVAREVFRQLPEEAIAYIGDTARVPYGGRSVEELLSFNREILGILLDQGVKAVVVACNTSSAIALPVLDAECPVPILGLIEAGARAAATEGRRIGVIATEATIRSRAHLRAIEALEQPCQVFPLACPKLVPMIEAGIWEGPEAEATVYESLAPLLDAKLDTLIFGCTHYPFLRKVIAGILGDGVRLVDPAEEAVRALGDILAANELLATERKAPHRIMVSGDPVDFLHSAKRLLGEVIDRVEGIQVKEALPLAR
ncbi:glutamate racemase [bacterium]|nr:glutamate racemase [bacterium]